MTKRIIISFFLILNLCEGFCQNQIEIPIRNTAIDCFEIVDTIYYPIVNRNNSYIIGSSGDTYVVKEKLISDKLKYFEIIDSVKHLYNILLMPNFVSQDSSFNSLVNFSSIVDTFENIIRFKIGPFSKLDYSYPRYGLEGNLLEEGEWLEWCNCDVVDKKMKCKFFYFPVCISDYPPYSPLEFIYFIEN